MSFAKSAEAKYREIGRAGFVNMSKMREMGPPVPVPLIVAAATAAVRVAK
jgi:hypothetical protein